MNEIREILRFGAPYLKRYWTRLAIGVVLGVFFGFSNALFVGATTTIFKRLDPDTEQTTPADLAKKQERHNKRSDFGKAVHAKFESVKNSYTATIDPFLPKKGRPLDLLQILGGLMVLPILGFFRGYVGYLSSYCMNWVSERVIKDMRLDVLLKLNSLSIDFFNRSTMGELLARVNGDTTALYRCLSLGFSDLVKEPVTIISLLIALLWLDPQLTVLALIFTPLTVIPIRILGKKAKKAVQSSLTMGMSQDSLLVEVYSSIRIVKAFGLENWQVERFRKIYEKLVHIGMKNVQAKELINPIIEVISMFGLGVVIVAVFYLQKDIPDLIGFLMSVILLYTPIKKLGGLHIYFQQASIGSQRLIQIFKEQPSVKERPDAVPIAGFNKEISFENVSFSYGDKTVLKDVNLVVPRGMKLGIAGPSGSGKSTLINLVLRFYDPVEGSVKIDGIDFRDVSLKELRSQMALVSQEVVIFDQTIAENIAAGKLGATQEEIEAAARAANAHDFIMGTPKGYQTRVGERGITLSGGQRQRISIARAFVRNAPILVLDEATGSLDSQSEAEIQATIDQLAENRTVICIAHRLSTLRSCDQVVVVHEGQIKERGTFDELLRNGPIFAWMAGKQGLRAPVEA
ncbi:MAG: ABC transporter ATP-binding protein [Verrucomicrobiales bacterium]